MSALVSFWLTHGQELATLVAEHVLLVAVSTAIAVAIGVPLAVFATRRPRLASPLVAIASVVQTIPSLAMFGFLLPVPLLGGIGARAALVVLVLYGLLPIVRSTIVGITGIDPSIRAAGVAMGMQPREILRQIELPLAMPAIVAGIRVAAVVGVGSATIAAAIGAGGLGQYIYRGLSMVDSSVILAGAIPAALLALVVDGSLLWVERRLSTRRRAGPARTAVAAAGAVAIVVLAGSALIAVRAPGAIVVGSKNFTEQLILGEIVAQTIERETGLPVQRRLNLGGTLISDRALLTGDVDVYVEYTGTALTAIFHQPVVKDPAAVIGTVRELYANTGRTLLAPLGYDNTFAILVRGADARARGLRTIDDVATVAPGWRAGFGYEFLERPDGYPGLAKTYGLTFRGPPQVMDLTLSYRALAAGQVDLIAGDATAGLIKGLDLFRLEDNRRYFPPYDAVPVARASTLLRYPQVRKALEGLAGRISAADMQEMNHAAEAQHEDPADIARRFLNRRARSAPVTRPSGQGGHNGRMRDNALRDHLVRLLDWEEAHVGFDKAVEGIPADKRGALAPGFEHSPWQLLEHLRLAQDDILDFCINSSYVHTMKWPDDYWPGHSPAGDAAWKASIAAFARARDAMKALARDVEDLTATVPTGKGNQTYLRAILLVADHTAYHVGQLVAVRRALGIWK